MITELRGCSLALQYPCLSQHCLSYHIISLNHGICGEIRSEDTKTSSSLYPPLLNLFLCFFSFSLSSAITITLNAFSDMVVVTKRPGCDTNSLVLMMSNKHQLTTHQSLWDSPILFRGEWIILPNPNTPSSPWLPGTIMLGHTPQLSSNYQRWGDNSRSDSQTQKLRCVTHYNHADCL